MRHRDQRTSDRSVRTAISVFFGFFITLTVTLIAAVLVIFFGVFQKNGIIHSLDDEFYRFLQEYIENKTMYYTLPVGIDPSVLDGVFQEATIRLEVKKSVTDQFDGTDDHSAGEEMAALLTENVRSVFLNEGVDITEETEEIITGYVNDIRMIYQESVCIPGISALLEIKAVYSAYFEIGFAVSIVIALISGIFLICLNRRKRTGCRYLGYGFGGAAFMMFLIPLIILLSKKYLGLALEPQFFYHLCINIIDRILHLCIVAAVLLLVLALIFFLTAGMRQRISYRDWNERI